jgi:hypothetical protein
LKLFSVELQEWKEQLSPEIDITLSTRHSALPHRIMLHLAYWWLFILLHRPFYRRAHLLCRGDQDIDHVKLCTRATDNIMELLGTWQKLYTLRYIPVTLIQVIFSAGTIFVLSAAHAISGSRPAHVALVHAVEQTELCIRYLSETGKSWACANHANDILRNLLHEQVGTNIFLRSIYHITPATIPPTDTTSLTTPRSGNIAPVLLGPINHLRASANVIPPFTSLPDMSSDMPERQLSSVAMFLPALQTDCIDSQHAADHAEVFMGNNGDQFRIANFDYGTLCVDIASTRPPLLMPDHTFEMDGVGDLYDYIRDYPFTESQVASLTNLLDEQYRFS